MRRNFNAGALFCAPGNLNYIDLFAGCGGLSLGLQRAGWEGVFAVERSPMAFETLQHNLIASTPTHFPHWPEWLPKQACSIQKLTKDYYRDLCRLRGKVTLVAGGPPCQGFSYAGKRQKHDYRNQLYRSYVEVVQIVRPALVLLENVTGISAEFGGKKARDGRGRRPVPYSERIRKCLEDELGYKLYTGEVLASEFGVPQSRARFVAVGIDTLQFDRCPLVTPFTVLGELRAKFLASKGLPTSRPVSCEEALSDLEYHYDRLADSPDTPRYMNGRLGRPDSDYQRLMRGTLSTNTVADSHRFVKHREDIVRRFRKILDECPRGKNIPDTFKAKNGIKKACIVPLDPAKPASTLTTIPDDMIHYSQARVMTVRECARLQSFPDSFQIRSKYTTGGSRRKVECPRYTQVGNAVPPLLGEALGLALVAWVGAARPWAAGEAPAEVPRVA